MFEIFFQEMNKIYPGISRSDCAEAIQITLLKTTNSLWKIVNQQRNEIKRRDVKRMDNQNLTVNVEIKGIEEAQTKVNEYVETLEKAKTLADELASVEFYVDLKN